MGVTIEYPTAKEILEKNDDLSNHSLADLWLLELGVNAVARTMLLPAVSEHFRTIRRGRVREIETRAFRKGGKPVDVDSWKRMLDSYVDIKIGKRVLIGDATRQDWEERIAFLESRKDGIDSSIERAHAIIKLLKAFKVRTLREIPEEKMQKRA